MINFHYFLILLFNILLTSGEVIPTEKETKDALQIVSKFLNNEEGTNWLSGLATGRSSPLTTIELMKEIINSTKPDEETKTAAQTVKLALEEQKRTGNTSEIIELDGWKDLINNVENQDDIICLYRKNSNVSTERSEDWRKFLKNVSPGYTIYLALDMGQKYVICLKKIDVVDATTDGITTTEEAVTVKQNDTELDFDDATQELEEIRANIGGRSMSSSESDDRCGDNQDESYENDSRRRVAPIQPTNQIPVCARPIIYVLPQNYPLSPEAFNLAPVEHPIIPDGNYKITRFIPAYNANPTQYLTNNFPVYQQKYPNFQSKLNILTSTPQPTPKPHVNKNINVNANVNANYGRRINNPVKPSNNEVLLKSSDTPQLKRSNLKKGNNTKAMKILRRNWIYPKTQIPKNYLPKSIGLRGQPQPQQNSQINQLNSQHNSLPIKYLQKNPSMMLYPQYYQTRNDKPSIYSGYLTPENKLPNSNSNLNLLRSDNNLLKSDSMSRPSNLLSRLVNYHLTNADSSDCNTKNSVCCSNPCDRPIVIKIEVDNPENKNIRTGLASSNSHAQILYGGRSFSMEDYQDYEDSSDSSMSSVSVEND